MTHRIIHLGTGVMPQELIFPSLESAQQWLDGYRVTQAYKDANYRIIPMNDLAAFVDVSTITEYGLTQKLSNSIRVY